MTKRRNIEWHAANGAVHVKRLARNLMADDAIRRALSSSEANEIAYSATGDTLIVAIKEGGVFTTVFDCRIRRTGIAR